MLTAPGSIYLIPECDTDEDVADVLHGFCDDIFTNKLEGWYRDTATWPEDRSYEMCCHWVDFQHRSMLVDLDDEPLVCEDY